MTIDGVSVQGAVAVEETALTIASTVAKAFPPPWGPAAAVAATTVGDILNYFFPDTGATPPAATLLQIADALKAQSTADQISLAHSQIGGTLSSFLSATYNADTPFPSSVNAALTEDPGGAFATLFKILSDAVTGITPDALSTPITAMTSSSQGDVCTTGSNEQAAFLGTFAFGVSVYTLMASYWISLVTAVDGKADSTNISLNEVVNQLTATPAMPDGTAGWIAYAEAACTALNNLIAARTSQVSPATPISFWDDQLFSGDDYAVYFADTGDPVANFDPTTLALPASPVIDGWPGSEWGGTEPLITHLGLNSVYAMSYTDANAAAVTAQVQQLRETYVAGIQEAIYKNYSDAGAVETAIASWKVIVQRIQAVAGGTT